VSASRPFETRLKPLRQLQVALLKIGVSYSEIAGMGEAEANGLLDAWVELNCPSGGRSRDGSTVRHVSRRRRSTQGKSPA
jgi:hypothetical protein